MMEVPTEGPPSREEPSGTLTGNGPWNFVANPNTSYLLADPATLLNPIGTEGYDPSKITFEVIESPERTTFRLIDNQTIGYSNTGGSGGAYNVNVLYDGMLLVNLRGTLHE